MLLLYSLSARKPWASLCPLVSSLALSYPSFVTRGSLVPGKGQLKAVKFSKTSRDSAGGVSKVGKMEGRQSADGEPYNTSLVYSRLRKYNTRSSVVDVSVPNIAKKLPTPGSVEPVEELGSDNPVEEAIVVVKALQKSRGPGRTKRSLTYDEPLAFPVEENGKQATGKPLTRSKRSKPVPQCTQSVASVTSVSSSPLAYFGFSDKESADKESAVDEEEARSLRQEAIVVVNTAVTYDGASSHLQESVVKNVVVSSGDAVTSLFEPAAVSLAVQHLKAVDNRLGTVIDMHEGPKFQKCDSAFVSLARSIVFQQLATKAATAIYGRVEALCGGSEFLSPEVICKLTATELRAVGISERKASYLHDLARHFMSGALSHSSILEMDDEALMAALTAVRGIGVWSVHMFMIFSLHRPDILPVGDLGVRKGFQKLFALKALPAPAQMEELASKWRPYRSLGSWYMWRILNMTLPFTTS